MTAIAPPFLVALNLTRRCNLRCAHCYLDAGTRKAGARDELATDEVLALLDRIAATSRETMVVLTGGEPLLRPDVATLARRAADLGLMVVVGTNGMLLDARRVSALRAAGVSAVGISLDSLDASYHDRFRGLPGAWQATLAGIDACRRGGLMFQIHLTVTDDNAAELDDMIAFAREAGAAVLNVFFVVCTGRGRSLTNISGACYERVLRRLAEAAREERDLVVRARCAPHFKRLARELSPPLPITLADGYEAGGCLAGTRYCRVTPEGDVTPCPYIEASAGSVRTSDFATLWAEAPLFASLRSPALEGRCGRCEYARLCGGCRARPLGRDGNLMGEDFLCRYEPAGGAVIAPATDEDTALPWSADAQARLAHVPPFVRRFVRQRAEAYARERGEAVVTAAHLHALAQRRFRAGAGPRRELAGGR
ncbi:MAG: radical SAM protein [Xanthobacteraceae bacterium]|nr:radical SAM protein [Xanthobacteraceae bacterium]